VSVFSWFPPNQKLIQIKEFILFLSMKSTRLLVKICKPGNRTLPDARCGKRFPGMLAAHEHAD